MLSRQTVRRDGTTAIITMLYIRLRIIIIIIIIITEQPAGLTGMVNTGGYVTSYVVPMYNYYCLANGGFA